MTVPVYELRDVTVVRDHTAILDSVSLSFESGNVIAILGPNGAGKSTLLSVLAGDMVPDHGTALMRGRELSAWSTRELARERAFMPQQAEMQFAFRVEQVVAMGRAPLPPASAEEEERAIVQAMERTSILPLRSRTYRQLSGGEQARTSFARVLTQETPIVLLDEPTASLDVRHQHDLMHTARQLAADGGTVIAIVHDINLACAYADSLVLMSRGRVLAHGTPDIVATPDLLTQAFSYPMMVMNHPYHNRPMVLSGGAFPKPAAN